MPVITLISGLSLKLISWFKYRSRLIIATLPVAFIVILTVSITTQLIVQTTADIQKTRYLLQAQALSDDLNLRLDTVNDEYVTAKLKGILSQADLYVYTNAFWSYTLTINGIPVDDSSVIIEKSSGAAIVVLTETRRGSPLPDAIIRIGSATRGDRSDSMGNHIKVVGAAAPMATTTAAPTVTATEAPTVSTPAGCTSTYAFTISDMKPGESFTIALSDQLGARLGMPSTEIQVTAAD